MEQDEGNRTYRRVETAEVKTGQNKRLKVYWKYCTYFEENLEKSLISERSLL